MYRSPRAMVFYRVTQGKEPGDQLLDSKHQAEAPQHTESGWPEPTPGQPSLTEDFLPHGKDAHFHSNPKDLLQEQALHLVKGTRNHDEAFPFVFPHWMGPQNFYNIKQKDRIYKKIKCRPKEDVIYCSQPSNNYVPSLISLCHPNLNKSHPHSQSIIFKHSLSQGCPRYLLECKSQGHQNKKSVHTSSVTISTAGNLLQSKQAPHLISKR